MADARLSETQGYSNMIALGMKYSTDKPGKGAFDRYNKYCSDQVNWVSRIDSMNQLLAEKQALKVMQKKLAREYVFKVSLRKNKYTIISMATPSQPRSELKHIRSQRWLYYHKENDLPIDSLMTHPWMDMEVVYDEANNSFNLVLLDQNGEESQITLVNSSLKAKPGKSPEPSRVAAWKRVFAKYTDTRDTYGSDIRNMIKQMNGLDKKITSTSDRADYWHKFGGPEVADSLVCFWQFSREFMTREKELAMCMDGWFEYFDANRLMMRARYSKLNDMPNMKDVLAASRMEEVLSEREVARQTGMAQMSEMITRKLNIQSFGTYNADAVKSIQDPVLAHATYVNEQNEAVKVTNIYIFDKNINGTIEYNGYRDFSPYKFEMDRTSTQMLFAFDAAYNTYVIEESFFQGFNPSGRETTVVFRLKAVDPKNKGELDAILAMN